MHRLIGTEVSLYTGKVRAYLRFKGIPFEEVLSTRQVYKELVIPRTGVRFIPVLITEDDLAIQDSTAIIDTLEARYLTPSVYPSTPVQRLVALLFEVYGDEWLVIPAMHYRWSIDENRRFAIDEFGRTSAPDATAEEQRALGERLAAPFAGALPYLGITPRTAPAIERSYEALLDDFERHLALRPYLLGARPSIGDYGLIGPLYAHLGRDPCSRRHMQARAPRVAAWVDRMQRPDGSSGDFLANDEVPDTLKPMLVRMVRQQVPVLHGTAQQLSAWARENPGASEVPRVIGVHDFTIDGVSETRAVMPYALWMWQRPHDAFHALNADARAETQRVLADVPGLIEALSAPLPVRVTRTNNRIHLAG